MSARTEAVLCYCEALGADLTFSKMWQNFSNLILMMNIFSTLALCLGRFEV